MKKTLLIIGAVWPEPNSSAAGSRMMQLIQLFLSENYNIIFASATAESSHRFPLEELGISIKYIELNNSSFDIYIQELQPEIVLFDRFMIEEQFGWRVEKYLPSSLRILDTEDLHCLRKARQLAFKENREFNFKDLNSEVAKREIASIYRSDLTLMISSFEMEILENHFKIPSSLVFYLPFLITPCSSETKLQLPLFEERSNFVTIGGFRHEPNWDSVLFLKTEVWPLLRKKLPKAELHIYGSYPSEKVTQLSSPKEKFFVKGWAKSTANVVKNAKVMLSPLRFGAGLKGKFIDAMQNGTPSVTTPIGAEAMHGELEWAGCVTSRIDKIISAAEQLYTDKVLWEQSQENGFFILEKCFSKNSFSHIFLEKIKNVQNNLDTHRSSNFVGQMLLFHKMRSTEFMSRWIEEKNK